jgi:DNA-binding SARP family transcriptional activator/Tol biopolymer transport system component
MVELRVLGTLQLRASDRRPVESLTHQARRAALLAYLAAAVPRGAHRRDKLFALFWPELDQAHARAALNQAVYVLRATLGEDAVVPRGDGALGLTDAVWCDAAAFEAALDAGHSAEALALYRGDLLDGFFITGAPEFERWLESERERLRRRASDGAWAVAEAKATEGNAVEAVRWARQAANLTPADEAAARRLMTLLNALGDRAAAINAYETFSSRLRQEYELEPSAETQALAASIRQGEQRSPAARSVQPVVTPVPTVEVQARRRRLPLARVAVSVVGVAALAAGAWVWLRNRPPQRPLVRFTLEFPPGQQMADAVGGTTIAVSPDGSHLVYVGWGPQGNQLFLRSMDRVEALPIPHTRRAHLPFFSPDGKWLGFVMGNAIRKVRLPGGPAITVCQVATKVPGASWGPNDVIVFATGAGLWQVPSSGGAPRLIAASDTSRGERYRWPEVLPNGSAAVFTRVDSAGFQLATVSLETGAVLPLGLEGTSPHFITPGYLLFARTDGAVLAAPFDRNALRITGPALPVADDVLVGIGGEARVRVSHAGVLAYVPEPSSDRTLAIVDRSGNAETVRVTPRGFTAARFSPDGRRVAAAVLSGDEGDRPDIWVLDRDATTFRRVTFDSGSVAPVWSPEGRRVAFATKPGGRHVGRAVRWIPADGSDSAETLLPFGYGQFPTDFTPDGQALLLQIRHPATGWDIWILPLHGERKPQPHLRGSSDEHSAAVSPDGRWVAYASDESGQVEVYVRAFPAPGTPVQISSGGGREPRWASSGRELFYRSRQGLVAVPVTTSPSFNAGPGRVLFDDKPYLAHEYGAAYDVHPDGRRFLMVRLASESPPVVVVLNWFAQLRAETGPGGRAGLGGSR